MTQRCILIVEDEWTLAASLAMLVEEMGHTVLGPAGTVKDALSLIAARPPDAALLDVSLDRERSFAIATDLEARAIPFFFVTGYSKANLPPAFAGHIVLEKPVPPEMIKDCIEDMLRRPAKAQARR